MSVHVYRIIHNLNEVLDEFRTSEDNILEHISTNAKQKDKMMFRRPTTG